MAFDDLAQEQDQPGILKSRDYFHSLIKAEMEKGIPSSRIVLGISPPASPLSIDIPIMSDPHKYRWFLPRRLHLHLRRPHLPEPPCRHIRTFFLPPPR